MNDTDVPRRKWGVTGVLALIARATGTTLPPGHGGYRALPEGSGNPDQRKPPPPIPRPSNGAATTARGSR